MENFSDHLPLHFSLKLSDFLSFPCPRNSSINSHCHPNHSHAQSSSSVNWFKVNPQHISSYCNHLSSSIPEFSNDILHCCDPDCTIHHVDLDSYCVQRFNCIESSAVLCLPTQGHCLRYAPLPSWNRSALTLKQSAQFWHKVWSDCGCPTSGVLVQIKKNSKRRFKYEVRRLRRHRNHIQCENLATVISYSNSQEFWKQVKKLSIPSSGAMSSSSVIDGCNNDIKYLTSLCLSSSHFSILSLIQHPAPIFNTVLRILLPPLPFPLFLSLRRSFMILNATKVIWLSPLLQSLHLCQRCSQYASF